MANTKISALTPGTPAVSSDVFPIDRAGANFSLTEADILNAISSGAVALTSPIPRSNGGLQSKSNPAFGVVYGGMNNLSMQQIQNNTGSTAGDYDLFTVPSNKRALVTLGIYNPATASCTYFTEASISSTYYRLIADVTATTIQNASQTPGIVLEAGSKFSIHITPGTTPVSQVASSAGTTTYTGTFTHADSNAWAGLNFTIAGMASANNGNFGPILTSSATTITVATTTQGNQTTAGTLAIGLTVVGTAFVFDNTSPLKSSILTSFGSGDTTVYTCPSSTIAQVAGFSSVFNMSGTSGGNYCNNSGGALAIHWDFVKNGGSVNGTTRAASNASVGGASGGVLGATLNALFTAGDLMSINTGSTNAAQIAWVNVIEQSA